MNIQLHNIKDIKISKVRKMETEEARVFYTKDFSFEDDNGMLIKITAFSNSEKNLKAK